MKRSTKFCISASAMAFWMVFMAYMIRPLNSKMIVAFEFAGSTEKANAILQEWSRLGIVTNAYLSIYLDFVFLALYSFTIYLALKWMFEISSAKVKSITRIFLVGIWIAPAMDIIENFALLSILSLPTSSATALAFLAAAIKFIVLISSLLYLLGGLIFTRFEKRGAR